MGSVAIPSGTGGGIRAGEWTSQTYAITSQSGSTKNITCEIGDLILMGTTYQSNKCNLSSYNGINIINGGVGKETTFAQAISENVSLTFSGGGNGSDWADIVVFHLEHHRNYDFNIVRAYGSSGSGIPQNFSNLKPGDVIVSLLGSTGAFGDMNSYNCGIVASNRHQKVYMAFADTASINFSSDYPSRIFATCRPK